MLILDGRFKEGGGQILRSALALSIITKTPFTINYIRGKRKKPGLLRQHLTCVEAAVAISNGDAIGAELKSDSLIFTPKDVVGGDYHFKIGSAGSASLVLQTILPPLLTADKPSTVIIEGGTHNSMAPPFDFLEKVFLPIINKIGGSVRMNIEQYGFYPVGGGKIVVTIKPRKLSELILNDRGLIKNIAITGIVANISLNIARMESLYIADKLGDQLDDEIKISCKFNEVPSPGPGNAVMVVIESEHVTELFTGFGTRGISWKHVAHGVFKESLGYLSDDVVAGEHLADQLLIPMAIGAGGSFITGPLSLHTETNIEIIKRFLDVEIEVERITEKKNKIKIGARYEMG